MNCINNDECRSQYCCVESLCILCKNEITITEESNNNNNNASSTDNSLTSYTFFITTLIVLACVILVLLYRVYQKVKKNAVNKGLLTHQSIFLKFSKSNKTRESTFLNYSNYELPGSMGYETLQYNQVKY